MCKPQSQPLTIYALKYGSYEGVELIDVFHTEAAAINHAKSKGLTQDDGTGGWYVEKVEVKV